MDAAPDRLRDLAKMIRSKNAGPFRLTFDVLFDDRRTYERVRDSGALSRDAIAEVFGVPATQISSIYHVDMANAIKITMFRPVVQGAPGETDSYGCQQHVPLMDIVIR